MRIAGIFLLLMVMSGCSVLRGPEADQTARLQALENFEMRGRIAVRSAERGGQGNLNWEQIGSLSVIRVSGPFGAGGYEIRWHPESLIVLDGDGQKTLDYEGPDAAQAWLESELGWSFPVASVRYWLLGVPDPAYPGEQQRSADGALEGLAQSDWNVTYRDFTEAAGFRVPDKLDFERDDLRIRVAIHRWDIPSEE